MVVFVGAGVTTGVVTLVTFVVGTVGIPPLNYCIIELADEGITEGVAGNAGVTLPATVVEVLIVVGTRT